MIRLPPKPVIWATVRTTCLIWLFLRTLVSSAAAINGDPVVTLPHISFFLMLGVAAIALIDITVARERLLLGNLGIGRRSIAGLAFLVSGLLEIVTAMALRAVSMGS